jgi:hypothetical protein
MRELKGALSEVVGVVTHMESSIWTPSDEGALALAAAELGEDDLGKFNDLGWYIPGKWTAYRLLLHLGWPDKQRLFVDYPLLTRALDKFMSMEEESSATMGSVDPTIGAVSSAPTPEPLPKPPLVDPSVLPGAPEPEPEWQPSEPYETPWETEEAAAVPVSGAMVAGAAVALLGVGLAVVYVVRS